MDVLAGDSDVEANKNLADLDWTDLAGGPDLNSKPSIPKDYRHLHEVCSEVCESIFSQLRNHY